MVDEWHSGCVTRHSSFVTGEGEGKTERTRQQTTPNLQSLTLPISQSLASLYAAIAGLAQVARRALGETLRRYLLLEYHAQVWVERAKLWLGSKPDMRRERIAAYGQVIASGLRPPP